MYVSSHSVPVSGDWDVGGGEGLSFCWWYVLHLCRPETVGQLCLFPKIADVQMHEADWQLPIYAWAVGGTGPLQDPSGAVVFLVPQASLEN